MAVALQLVFEMPLSLAYVVSALVVIPIVTHGFTFISRFQVGTPTSRSRAALRQHVG